MSKSRVGPEAKIISLFTALPDDSKRIVLDIIKAQSAVPRKASTKKAIASAPAQKDLSVIEGAKCAICGNVLGHPDHDRSYIKSHDFEGPKPVARATRKSKQKSEATNSTPSIEAGTESVLAASSAGD